MSVHTLLFASIHKAVLHLLSGERSTAGFAAFLPLPWLHGGHSHGLHCELSSICIVCWCSTAVHCGLPGLLASNLAPSWTLFFCILWWISPLSMWGSPWAAEGHWGCLSAWLLGSVLLRLGLSSCAGLAHVVSPSLLSMADFFSETKLKASFSVVSQFAVLTLTQLSKVLKWNWNVYLCLALTHSWKILK